MALAFKNVSSEDVLSRLFETPVGANDTGIVAITIEALGPRWWIVHRSDGRSGGIFDDFGGAQRQALLDARALPQTIVEIIDAAGSRLRNLYLSGEPVTTSDRPVLKIVR